MKTRPFAIRLTEDEREQLERDAGSKPLGVHIRERLLGSDASWRKSYRKPKANDVMLAHILARLGASDLSSNMSDIADAARIGALPESPDVLLDIQAACLAVQKMRYDLIKALGLKPEV